MNWIDTHKWTPYKVRVPILVITFDDGFATDFEVFKNARGIKATSYIITSRVGTQGYLTWEEIRQLRKAGWACECHTHTHPDLTTLQTTQIQTEMENVNAAFEFNGLTAPKHHANPYGATSANVRSIIAQYRDSQRAGLGGVFNYSDITANHLTSIAMDMGSEADLARVKTDLRNAHQMKGVVIGYLHELTDDPAFSKCLRSLFWEAVDYALELGFRIWTVESMLNYVSWVTQ